MLRRPFCGMAVSLLLGILTAAYQGRLVLAGMAAGVVCLSVALGRWWTGGWTRRSRMQQEKAMPERADGAKRRMLLRIVLCVGMFLLGRYRYVQEQEFRAQYLPYLENGMQLSVQGKLSGKQIRNHQYIYELTSCMIGLYQSEISNITPVSCNRILVYSDSDVSSIGEILILDGTVELWEPAVNEGGFDAKAFYEARKIDFKMTDIVLSASYGRESVWREALWHLRLQLKEVYQRAMQPEEGSILTTMVIGDKELLGQETKRLYQVGGLSHIMAISGLHISVIGMTLYRLLRKCGLGFLGAGAMAGILMYGYGTMVGMGISVSRAVIMFLLLLAGQALGRGYDTLNALGVAAVLLLLDNPYLPADAGFLFSFAAITGVVWVGGSVIFSHTRAGAVCGKLFVSVAVQAATLPLVAWYYYEIPVYAMVLNLLVLPMMGILLAFGVIGGGVGLISERLAVWLLFPCQKLLECSSWLCGRCAGWPGALFITGRPETWRVLLYYILLAAFTLLAYRKRKLESAGESGSRGYANISGALTGGVGVLFAGVILVALLCVPAVRGAELDVLDVGQGDGTFLRTQRGGTVFVDGGSANVGKVGEYRILPFLKYNGVRHIDCWLVSHADADHISGLEELLVAGYEIRRLVFSEHVPRDDAQQELEKLARAAGAEVLYLKPKEVLHLGTARLEALFPLEECTDADRNASSLVLLYEEGGFSGIFTGDIGINEEKQIVEGLKARGAGRNEAEENWGIDFYKAAHHGSKYSNSNELLTLLKPKVTAVSCGVNNRYGHPAKEAVRHMEDAGSTVFYTMDAGQITVTWTEGEVRVEKYTGPPNVYVFAD